MESRENIIPQGSPEDGTFQTLSYEHTHTQYMLNHLNVK